MPAPRPLATTATHVGKGGELVLVIVSEEGTSVVPLVRGKDVVLGRADDCEITINDASVSRKHTAIGGEPLRVEDLGSRNGTYLFGERLEPGRPVPLPVGASLELGTVSVLVQRAAGPLAELLSSSTAASAASNAAAPTALPPSFIAVDARTLRVVRLAELIAQRPIHVTILGEPGVGKETLARFVHERSTRSSHPFVSLVCGPSQGETAWTDAWTKAAEGTLYIDGLQALGDEQQASLARRIEAEPQQVRVIASMTAAHGKDGHAPVRVELVRSVSGFTLRMPRLCERVADIKPLAEHFARIAATRAGRAITPVISRRALARLEAYAWPLEVAELARTIDAAVLASGHGPIDDEHIAALGIAGNPKDEATRGHLRDAVEEVERRRVLDALAEAGGNQTLAAKKLGIARGTLIARLQAYGVARPRKNKAPP